MEYLVKTLDIIDAERFISGLLRERFNYTEWRGRIRQGASVSRWQKRTEKILKEIDLLKRNIVTGALRGKRGTNAPKEKCEVI